MNNKELDHKCDQLETMYAKVFYTQQDAFQSRYEAYQSGLVEFTGQKHALDVVGSAHKWRIVLAK